MSHLDEGTLHALLDGELDLHEVKEIQAHIGSCAACGTRLREVKEFHGEADRLVGVLELPTSPSRRTAPADPDRQARLHRLRFALRVAQVEELAVEGGAFLGEQAPHVVQVQRIQRPAG